MKRTKDSQMAATWSLKLERGDLLRSASELKSDLAKGRIPVRERERVARDIVGLELLALQIERKLQEIEADEIVEE
jgi:hypothetical protein